MTAAVRLAMPVAGFPAWEEGQAPRREPDGFRPVAMTGGTMAAADRLRPPEIGVEISMAAFYAGVGLGDGAPEAAIQPGRRQSFSKLEHNDF